VLGMPARRNSEPSLYGSGNRQNASWPPTPQPAAKDFVPGLIVLQIGNPEIRTPSRVASSYTQLMRDRLTKPERWSMALLALIAALTFFFPLFSIHIPIAGDKEVTGYDTASRIRELTHEVRAASGHGQDGKPSVRLPKIPRGDSSAPSKVPFSVRFSWLIPVFIIGAFGCAVLTLFGSLVSLQVSKLASTLGTVCGVLTVVHLTAMNSAIHNMLEESIQQGMGDLKANPLAGLAQALGSVLINTISLRPGGGLYILTALLGLAAFLAHSRLLSRIHSSEREP
jgi:hypothetical protein